MSNNVRNYRTPIVAVALLLGMVLVMVFGLISAGMATAANAREATMAKDAPATTLAASDTLTVTTTADSGPGSLRQSLLAATPGTTITFDLTVFPPAAPATITLSSPLPEIVTDTLTIDGSNAGVVLDGGGLSGGDGLVIFGADGVKIHGLQILNFPLYGIVLFGGVSNTIIGGDRSISH